MARHRMCSSSKFSFGEIFRQNNIWPVIQLYSDIFHDFGPYIQQYTSPNKYFEYVYPLSNALLGLFMVKIFVLSQIRYMYTVRNF